MNKENNKYFYFFNDSIFNKNHKNYNSQELLNLFGNKAKNLGDLWHLSNFKETIKVPFGGVFTYNLIKYYLENNKFPEDFYKELDEVLIYFENITGKKINSSTNPLIFSIRSSGSISLPGILDTFLNIGITTNMINEIEKSNISKEIEFFKDIYEKNLLKDMDNVKEQISTAIKKIIESLNGDKLKMYFTKKVPDLTGGIIIQEMVFGNKNENSYTGVVFSSNPQTGKKELFGEYLSKSQGNLLVNGEVTPYKIELLKTTGSNLYNEIQDICNFLEIYYHYIQDIEFTVENNQLYILQTRNGELSTKGKIVFGERLVKDNIISKKEFFKKNYVENIYNIKEDFINEDNIKIAYKNNLIIGEGLGITNNVIEGVIATSYEEVLKYKDNNSVIFVTEESNPNHMNSINLSKGLLTMRGGATSHGAVVARGRNIVGILSVNNLTIEKEGIYINNIFYANGSKLILDGTRGLIIDNLNNIISIEKTTSDNYEFFNWNTTPIKVRVNGETVEEMKNANKFHMDGVGLCRIEHIFLEEPGLTYIRNILKYITNNHSQGIINKEEENLKNYLIENFNNLFDNINGLPICIRLIDPPIHEFLPEDIYKEHNPMMGNRGARLMVIYEKLCELQIESIFLSNFIERKKPLPLEIMVPFIFSVEELIYIKNIINNIRNSMEIKYNIKINYKFGVMVELPKAVFVIENITKEVDFICFGTNDLTQMTFGLSRDDSNLIINEYIKKGILKFNPFITLDETIKLFIQEVVTKAKAIKEDISLGICGEHAGDEESIKFLSTLPLSYISVSAFRITSARYFLNKYY